MSNVDWSKAPEGFPIWVEDLNRNQTFDQSGWHADRGDRYEDQRRRYWLKSDYHAFRVHERPAAMQWNGEGLPPIGAVVEAFYMGIPQGVVTVRYAGQCMILWSDERNSEQCGAAEHYLFRPIRTPEQIAAEARERAVDEMWSVYWQPHAATAKEGLGLLYDAGYRKQEQPE